VIEGLARASYLELEFRQAIEGWERAYAAIATVATWWVRYGWQQRGEVMKTFRVWNLYGAPGVSSGSPIASASSRVSAYRQKAWLPVRRRGHQHNIIRSAVRSPLRPPHLGLAESEEDGHGYGDGEEHREGDDKRAWTEATEP